MALSLAEMRAKIQAKLDSMPRNIGKTPPPIPAINESVAVIEQPTEPVSVTVTEPATDINVIEPITEDSAIVQELEDNEPDDDKFIVIGGHVFSKDNPFFQKMMGVWEQDEKAKTGECVALYH